MIVARDRARAGRRRDARRHAWTTRRTSIRSIDETMRRQVRRGTHVEAICCRSERTSQPLDDGAAAAPRRGTCASSGRSPRPRRWARGLPRSSALRAPGSVRPGNHVPRPVLASSLFCYCSSSACRAGDDGAPRRRAEDGVRREAGGRAHQRVCHGAVPLRRAIAIAAVAGELTGRVARNARRGRADVVDTGAGGSGSGFIIHPDGLILDQRPRRRADARSRRARARAAAQRRHRGAA